MTKLLEFHFQKYILPIYVEPWLKHFVDIVLFFYWFAYHAKSKQRRIQNFVSQIYSLEKILI